MPAEWKLAASAYLKAWSATLEPSALQNLGELLAKAGYADAARETFNVILRFPDYATKVYGDKHDDLVSSMLENKDRYNFVDVDLVSGGSGRSAGDSKIAGQALRLPILMNGKRCACPTTDP